MQICEVVVLDNGSGSIKSGMGGDDKPQSIFPTMVGDAKEGKERYIGNEAKEKRDLLTLKYPIKQGIIKDWEEMEKIWNHTFFQELKISPNEVLVLLTEIATNLKANREKMTQIMIETFDVVGLYIAVQSVLSLYETGRTTGTVLDSGEGISHVVPIYEGYFFPHATSQLEIAGTELTEYLMKMYSERGFTKIFPDRFTMMNMKEKLCFVSLEFEKDMERCESFEEKYELPDGNVIVLGSERFRCAEALFQPNFLGIESEGIHEIAFNSINKCDFEIRKDLYLNFILSGGNTLFPGFEDRIYNELTCLAPENMKVKVIAPKNRINSSWLGGSILSSLNDFQKKWVTKQDYDETGPTIIHRKCF